MDVNAGINSVPKDNVNSKLSSDNDNLWSYELLAILLTIFILIITTVFFLWRRLKVDRRCVLLMGLCDSGKTLIYCRLIHNKYVSTFTSEKENVDELPVRGTTVKLVDVPGHERLRYKFFEDYKSTARGIVFVIDSFTFAKDVRDVAEFLYTILSDRVVQANRVPIFVACNKQDETLTKSARIIEELLAKEITVLRLTKTNQLQGTSELADANVYLGKEGKDFEFKDVANAVDFGETSALKNDRSADLEVIDDWLVAVA